MTQTYRIESNNCVVINNENGDEVRFTGELICAIADEFRERMKPVTESTARFIPDDCPSAEISSKADFYIRLIRFMDKIA